MTQHRDNPYMTDPVWAERIIAHGIGPAKAESLRATAKNLREGCLGQCRGYCASRAAELERWADEIAARCLAQQVMSA